MTVTPPRPTKREKHQPFRPTKRDAKSCVLNYELSSYLSGLSHLSRRHLNNGIMQASCQSHRQGLCQLGVYRYYYLGGGGGWGHRAQGGGSTVGAGVVNKIFFIFEAVYQNINIARST